MTAGAREPVADWATDFDHLDPAWATEPHAIWDDLRQRCPVAHTDRYGGVWLPTRYDDVRAVAYDTENFTSLYAVVEKRPPDPVGPWGNAPPLTADPPHHRPARMLLLPAFSAAAVAELEPFTRQLCDRLLDAIEGRDTCDAAKEYAQHVPATVISHLLGLPGDDADFLRGYVRDLVEGLGMAPEERRGKRDAFMAYLDRHIDAHEAEPRDDLIGHLLQLELDGLRLSREQVRGMVNLVVVAGVDTTWSAIGASIWHLATHPDDRRRLLDEPSLLPSAIEEFLRAYSPVSIARRAVKDIEVGGSQVAAGDWVLLPFPAANRDPDHFTNAGRVVIDRERNRHCAFGLGIHRCLGAGLARMEIRVALERWLARIPEFELDDPGAVTWSAGQTRGPRAIPMRIGWRRP